MRFKKKKIALVGYFGWGNFGDELFIEAHKQHLADKYELFVANDLTEPPYFSGPVENVIDEADAILIGGGDLVQPLRVSPLYWNFDYLNKPTYVFGVGVPREPFRRNNVIEHYREFMTHSNCRLVVARDKESYLWLKDTLGLSEKLTWFPDPVCSLNFPQSLPREQRTLGIVVRELRTMTQPMDPVIEMLEHARSLNYKIKHLVLATGKAAETDVQRSKFVKKDFPEEELVISDDLDVLCAELSTCSVLFTMKFHGLVVATMYGIPAISLVESLKNTHFLRMLGHEERQHPWSEPELYKLVPDSPESIPGETIEKLRSESTRGYELLRAEIDKVLSPPLHTKIVRKARWYKIKVRRFIRERRK